MTHIDGNKELASLGISKLEISLGKSTPGGAAHYYIQTASGAVHGPCQIALAALPGDIAQAAQILIHQIERALVEYSFSKEVVSAPSGILSKPVGDGKF